ncbi:MAG: hypothetical protein MZV70_58830 [Desulfobacterales bacterium]|nr:hypothetical protein [Desulfobacterales bacterium]
MSEPSQQVPTKAWVVTFAGTAVNLCLGILYAWSVWAKALINEKMVGQPMTGMNEGWVYLNNAQTSHSLLTLRHHLRDRHDRRRPYSGQVRPESGRDARRPLPRRGLYHCRHDEEL